MKDSKWLFQTFTVKVFTWPHYQKISNEIDRDGNTAERGRDWDVTSVGMSHLKIRWGMWCRLTL